MSLTCREVTKCAPDIYIPINRNGRISGLALTYDDSLIDKRLATDSPYDWNEIDVALSKCRYLEEVRLDIRSTQEIVERKAPVLIRKLSHSRDALIFRYEQSINGLAEWRCCEGLNESGKRPY